MRREWFALWRCLTIACLLCSARSLAAATIEGRVVDSAGQPVAAAEVRIWQKLPEPGGRGVVDQPVEFDGGEVLKTDAAGRFVSPDVLVGEAFAKIIAAADGMLAGRSDWIAIPKDAAAQAPEITLKRLRIVTGLVHDRRGQPVDGATVFNTGDGHERVETTSKGGGKFRLANVPEGGVFLFAEKDGYRFAGVRLPAGQAEAALTLTSLDEPAEPLAALPPLLSPEEEYALAREVLDPWLERVAKTGPELDRIGAFTPLIQINPREALERLDAWADLFQLNLQNRGIVRHAIIRSFLSRRDRVAWDELRELIDASDDAYELAAELIAATDEMHRGERALRLEWLEAALPHARKIDAPPLRARTLAGAADRFFQLGEVDRGRQILAEAEEIAKPLLAAPDAHYAFVLLALAAAHDDADRAIGWLEKSGPFLPRHGGRVAARLLPDRPRRAVEIWRRIVAAHRAETRIPLQGYDYRGGAEFCYRLARVDRALAEQVAAGAENEAMRVHESGAIILALAETAPDEARKQLAALVREELPRLRADDSLFPPEGSAPAVAAWLLPAAEQVAPDLGRELVWRSVALRRPRPGRDDLGLGSVVEHTDIELAKRLGRYDRELARAVLEPSAVRLPELAALAEKWSRAAGPVPVPVQRAASEASLLTHRLFLAAIHIDPGWARSMIDTVGDSAARIQAADKLRYTLVYTLGLPDRWHSSHEYSAGFWTPAARDKPLQP